MLNLYTFPYGAWAGGLYEAGAGALYEGGGSSGKAEAKEATSNKENSWKNSFILMEVVRLEAKY